MSFPTLSHESTTQCNGGNETCIVAYVGGWYWQQSKSVVQRSFGSSAGDDPAWILVVVTVRIAFLVGEVTERAGDWLLARRFRRLDSRIITPDTIMALLPTTNYPPSQATSTNTTTAYRPVSASGAVRPSETAVQGVAMLEDVLSDPKRSTYVSSMVTLVPTG